MVGPRGPQPDARSVIEPQPTTLRLFLGNLQPLPPPDTLNTFGVHVPSLHTEQGCNPAIAVAAIEARQPYDGRRQCFFVRSAQGLLALGRTVLADDPTNSALRNVQLALQMLYAAPTTSGAQ
jgi:hypothetical protein